jgi:hypothetical protein
MNCTKAQIVDIIKAASVKGYSKLNKDELAEKAEELLLSESFIRSLIISLDDYGVDTVLKMADNKPLNEKENMRASMLVNMGYAFSDKNGNTELCEGVGKAFLAGYKELKGMRAWMRSVLVYCEAFCNLYGYIKIDKAYELYNSQNKGLTPENFRNVVAVAENLTQNWIICGDYIAAIDTEKYVDVETLIKKQDVKPYFVPGKKDIGKYVNNDYRRENPNYWKLCEFIERNFHISKEKADEVCFEISMNCEISNGMRDVVDILERNGLKFGSKMEIAEFGALYQFMHNSTKMRVNRGYSPDELGNIYGKLTPTAVLSAPMTEQKAAPFRSAKVGRNEPCPCGSGKKYKKCCGR